MWNFQHLAQGAVIRIPVTLLGVANSAKVAPPPHAASVCAQERIKKHSTLREQNSRLSAGCQHLGKSSCAISVIIQC
jgi:hypothetical protein